VGAFQASQYLEWLSVGDHWARKETCSRGIGKARLMPQRNESMATNMPPAVNRRFTPIANVDSISAS